MIRMSDIAARAGLSRTTVSCVLNNKHEAGISEETRQRVLQAAKELNYRRNEIARQMVSGRSRVLGFVLRSTQGDVASRILTGVLETAEESEYSVKVVLLDFGKDPAPVFERLAGARLAGVMALYLDGDSLGILQNEMAHAGDVPVAVLDSSFPQSRGIRILSDDITGCRAVIDHLADLGHTRIAYVAGREDSGASQFRETGFRTAMAAHEFELAPWQIFYGDWHPDEIARAVTGLWQHPEGVRPTALMCADDKTALAAIRTLRGLGYSVPKDVSVVGFADLEMAAFCDPPLTTVSQPFREMGRTAVRTLIDLVEGNGAGKDVLLPTQLVVRQSTAPANIAVSPPAP
jgi:DNA-binding LacI/PurR family transcriptional regulator